MVTLIVGLKSVGINLALKKTKSQTKIGVPGKKNWEVKGILITNKYNKGMNNLKGNGGVDIK